MVAAVASGLETVDLRVLPGVGRAARAARVQAPASLRARQSPAPPTGLGRPRGRARSRHRGLDIRLGAEDREIGEWGGQEWRGEGGLGED